MDCANAALFIAIQCGLTGIAWGCPGVAKTAFFESLSRAIECSFYKCFIPSMHMPEDIGGVPDIDRKTGMVTMRHLDWLHNYTKPRGMLVIDEATTAPQPMRPPLQSIMGERRVGAIEFHPTTIVVVIANPPEFAPNSSPLEPSMLNRLYHHDWVSPFDTWYKGMLNGGKFDVPSNFPIVGDTSAYLPKWTALIGRLCYRHPAIRETRTVLDGERAFASYRAWFNLAKALAGANKVGASGDIYNELACGLVGTNNATQLMRWIAALDLYDANAVIDGSVTVEYGEDRIDQLIYLPVGIMEALRDDHSSARLDSAVAVLVEMAENGMIDTIMPVMGEISSTYEDYRMPKKLLGRYGSLIKQIGGAS
jgi:hypothetical protein